MIDETLIRRIRDLRADSWPIRGIANEVGVARNTVKRYLRLPKVQESKTMQAEAHFQPVKRAHAGRRPKRGDVKAEQERLAKVGQEVTYPRLAREFRQERIGSLDTGASQPGNRAEVNWGRGSLGQGFLGQSFLGRGLRRRRTVWAFTMQLSWSGAIYVELVAKRSPGAFMQCHLNAFKHFGGIPRRCFYPPECSLAVKWDPDGSPRWNPGLKLAAAWAGFQPEYWMPYLNRRQHRSPNPIKHVREVLLQAPEFDDIADLNLWTKKNVKNVYAPKSANSAGPDLGTLIDEERDCLQKFPHEGSHPEQVKVPVQQDGTVRVENRELLVSLEHIHRQVKLVGRGREMQVWSALTGQRELLSDYCLSHRADLGVPEMYDGLCLFGMSEEAPERMGAFIDRLLEHPEENAIYRRRAASRDIAQTGTRHDGDEIINLEHWLTSGPLGWLGEDARPD